MKSKASVSGYSGVLNLIALIYDSALDPSRWPAFLEAFSDSVDGGSTTLVFHDMVELQGTIAVSVRTDPECERMYNQHYGRCDPWRTAWLKSFRRAGPNGVVTSEQLIEPAELRTTEFYNDFLVPNHIGHQFCGPIVVNDQWSAVLNCLRPPGKRRFGRGHVELLRTLLPHLERAIRLQRSVGMLQAQLDTSLQSFDLLSTGFVLVDRNARVLFINRTARRIVDQKDGLTFHSHVLAAADSAETAALHKAIREAWMTASGSGLATSTGTVAVSRPSGRRRLSLTIVPLRVKDSQSRLFSGIPLPTAALLISDPEAETTGDAAALRQSFGLTAAEARLATLLMTGMRLERAADLLAVSMNTAKTQLKAIFSKTETSRQGEMVRVLLLSVAQVGQL